MHICVQISLTGVSIFLRFKKRSILQCLLVKHKKQVVMFLYTYRLLHAVVSCMSTCRFLWAPPVWFFCIQNANEIKSRWRIATSVDLKLRKKNIRLLINVLIIWDTSATHFLYVVKSPNRFPLILILCFSAH